MQNFNSEFFNNKLSRIIELDDGEEGSIMDTIISWASNMKTGVSEGLEDSIILVRSLFHINKEIEKRLKNLCVTRHKDLNTYEYIKKFLSAASLGLEKRYDLLKDICGQIIKYASKQKDSNVDSLELKSTFDNSNDTIMQHLSFDAMAGGKERRIAAMECINALSNVAVVTGEQLGLEMKDSSGHTPLAYLMEISDATNLCILINSIANAAQKTGEKLCLNYQLDGKTPLHHAITFPYPDKEDNVKVIKALADAAKKTKEELRFDMIDGRGRGILKTATVKGDPKIVVALLEVAKEAGMDIGKINNDLKYVMEWAEEKDHKDVIKALELLQKDNVVGKYIAKIEADSLSSEEKLQSRDSSESDKSLQRRDSSESDKMKFVENQGHEDVIKASELLQKDNVVVGKHTAKIEANSLKSKEKLQRRNSAEKLQRKDSAESYKSI